MYKNCENIIKKFLLHNFGKYVQAIAPDPLIISQI
jgi:hypothetical protein